MAESKAESEKFIKKTMTLAELLNLRKHLQAKVEQLRPVYTNGVNGVLETKVQRKPVNESVDEVTMQVAKITMADVTKEYDTYAKALRQVENKIQEVNYTTKVDLEMSDRIAI